MIAWIPKSTNRAKRIFEISLFMVSDYYIVIPLWDKPLRALKKGNPLKECPFAEDFCFNSFNLLEEEGYRVDD